MILEIIISISLLVSILCLYYLIRKFKKEELIPEKAKQFSKEEIKERPGTYFDRKEIK